MKNGFAAYSLNIINKISSFLGYMLGLGLIYTGVVVLSENLAVADVTSGGWTYSEIDANERTISMSVPGLKDWIPGVTIGEAGSFGGGDKSESVLWNSFEDNKPNAGITVNISKFGFDRYTTGSISRSLGWHMGSFKRSSSGFDYIKLDGEYEHENDSIGEFDFMYFNTTASGVKKKCVFFHRAMSNKRLADGWYCAGFGGDLTEKTARKIIESIDLDWNPGKTVVEIEADTIRKDPNVSSSPPESEVTTSPPESEVTTARSTSPTTPGKHPIAVTWEGHPDPVIGYITMNRVGSVGSMSLTNPFDGSQCTGSYLIGDGGKRDMVACLHKFPHRLRDASSSR